MPYKEGPYKEGPYKEGPYKEGPYKEGPYKEGPYARGRTFFDADSYGRHPLERFASLFNLLAAAGAHTHV